MGALMDIEDLSSVHQTLDQGQYMKASLML